MGPAETRLRPPPATERVPEVHAIIPAFGGRRVLERLLASLESERPALQAAIVVNNACDPEIASLAAAAAVPTSVVAPPCNLGTAGGITAGLREFLRRPTATHAWILDDDASATPGALTALLAAMREADADLAAPLIAEQGDRVTWIPCRIPHQPRDFLRSGLTREDFVRRCGDVPRSCNWAVWASLLLSRRAVESAGFPRWELWSQFTDIEYTLRITEQFRGVLTPKALCHHRPAVSVGAAFDAKLYAALQNGAYVGLRLSHGRRARRHLPGLLFRYLKHYRWRPAAWRNAIDALWEGAVLGRPSGRTSQAAQLAQAEAADFR